MDEQCLEEDEETVTRLQEKNKNLENKLEQVNGQLCSFISQLESVKRKLKKAEFERDSFHSQMESLKGTIKKLSKELHEEKKKNKMTQIRLTELESCRSGNGANIQSSGQILIKQPRMGPDSGGTPSKDLQSSLKEAAEEAMGQNGFVYDNRTGLYYDYSSGFYYDPNSQLYYDHQSGTYYHYDQESNSFKFHSQVSTSKAHDSSVDEDGSNEAVNREGTIDKPITVDDSEESDGEILEHDDKMDEAGEGINQNKSSSLSTEQEATETHPISAPCVRAIITSSSTMKVGMLFMITCQGGTLGRDKDLGHVVRISDIELSKKHCIFEYDHTRRQYFIIDCGSKNGTFLNGQRLSKSQESSADHVLTHGDRLTVGGTTLLLHIHPGNDTCYDCEPGLVQAKELHNDFSGEVSITKVVTTSSGTSALSLDEQRKKLLKKIKKGYFLENSEYSHEGQDITSQGRYKDRATVRRTKVGSDVLSDLPDAAPSSVYRPIDSENKGRKMLEKMGWKQGEGLGREGGGRTEPVTVQLRDNGRGLGAGTKRSLDEAGCSGSRTHAMAKARERFARIEAETLTESKFTQDFKDSQVVQSRKKDVVNSALPPDELGIKRHPMAEKLQKPGSSTGTPVDMFAE